MAGARESSARRRSAPRASIVIPCLDAEAFLGVQLEALASQRDAPPFEVIIADNGSRDGSREVATAFMARLPGLRLVDASQRPGQAHARNVGAAAASGEVLLFCDADDEVGADWVARMSVALEQHDFVACRVETGKLNSAAAVEQRPNPQGSGLIPYDYPKYLPHAAGASLGVRKALHEQVGGFDPGSSPLEDCDYCWRIQLLGHTLHFVPDAVVHYRFRERLRDVFRQAVAYGEGNVRLYVRYRERGMPRLPVLAGLSRWAGLVARVPSIGDPGRRLRWVWQLGWRWGRLRASVAQRTWSLCAVPVLSLGGLGEVAEALLAVPLA